VADRDGTGAMQIWMPLADIQMPLAHTHRPSTTHSIAFGWRPSALARAGAADGADRSVRRLRRKTPRDVATDKGAFDAALTVRRPLGLASAALGDARVAFVQDCLVGAFAPLGECSASCGGGRRTRRRPVEVPAKHGGEKCASTEEADACNTGGCAVPSRVQAERSAGRFCLQALRFKVDDDVVDQDGERCRVVSVDAEDFVRARVPERLEVLGGRVGHPSAQGQGAALRRRWILAR
jgi:hypothetical protein